MDVVCNGLAAVFLVARMVILLPCGRDISPTEFERMAGKGASKKWKVRAARSHRAGSGWGGGGCKRQLDGWAGGGWWAAKDGSGTGVLHSSGTELDCTLILSLQLTA